MNRVFQVIYNEHRGKYMVCDETRHLNVKSKSAKLLTVAALLGLSMMSGVASAAPGTTGTGLLDGEPHGSSEPYTYYPVYNPAAGGSITLKATETDKSTNSVTINPSTQSQGVVVNALGSTISAAVNCYQFS